MIRGAFIFAVGLVLGYSKAMHEIEEIKDLAQEAKGFLRTLSEEDNKTVGETPADDITTQEGESRDG